MSSLHIDICLDCGMCFYKTFEGTVPFECISCSNKYEILFNDNLIKQISSLSLCDECGKCFKNRKSVTKHKLHHNRKRVFQCVECNKAYMRKDHLRRHMNTHLSVVSLRTQT